MALFRMDTSRFCDEVFDNLKNRPDVTILLGGKTFFGNRVILSNMSAFFQQTLAGQSGLKSPVINLGKGAAVDADTFEKVMTFLNHGYVTLPTKQGAAKFVSLARSLGLRDYKNEPIGLEPAKTSVDASVMTALDDHEEDEAEMMETPNEMTVAFTDPSEADTDIEEQEDEKEEEEDFSEISTILRQISYAISMTKINNNSNSFDDDGLLSLISGMTADSHSVADSLESSGKPRPLAPIRAERVQGECGADQWWQCRDCQYWCYSDADIRRHERRLGHLSTTIESGDPGAGLSGYGVFAKNGNARKAADSGRVYKLRTRSQRLGGICGDYYQCRCCRYWNYSPQGVRVHQRKMGH